MSQESTASTASSILCDLLENEDASFVRELETVTSVYKIVENSELSESDHYSNNDEEDDESGQESVSYHDDEGTCDQRLEDLTEFEKRRKFLADTCGCSKIYKSPCSNIIDADAAISYREMCLELEKTELEMCVKVQLFAHRRNDGVTGAKKHKPKTRERVHQDYYFNGKQICRNTFMFVHGISKFFLEAICKSLDSDGFQPRVHGNTGKLPKHGLTMVDIERVKQFLNHYASQFGVHLPGRLPNYKDSKITLLPSDKSKSDIHQEYQKCAIDMSYRKISLSEFKKLWLEHCPYLVLMKPATDLCSNCQKFTQSLNNGGNLTEEEKSEILQNYSQHLDRASTQRDYYRECCQQSKECFLVMSDEQKQIGQASMTYDGTLHYSFDYAQQVYYPHYSQQVGPLYFKTPRKCNCFGICSEGSGTQIFYLVDEAEDVGKGANSVISMLHHFFESKSYGETSVKLHMDNCSGQNKNNAVIWYGIWRVMTGRHKNIKFCCMEAGHTKFYSDWHFGLWKVKWRLLNVETLSDVAASVLLSSRNGHNLPQLVNDSECPVKFF